MLTRQSPGIGSRWSRLLGINPRLLRWLPSGKAKIRKNYYKLSHSKRALRCSNWRMESSGRIRQNAAKNVVKLQRILQKEVGQTKPFHIHLAVKKGKDEDDPEAG